MGKKPKAALRCEGYRRHGGAFSLGPVEWKQCENDATVIEATFEQVKEECRDYIQSQILWAPCCIFTNSTQPRVDLGDWYDAPEGRYDDALFFITLKDAIKEWGSESTTCWEDVIREEEGQPVTLIDAAKRYLTCEFEEYAAWCKGEVYYYDIQRKDADGDDRGDSLDSCGGFIGYDFENNGLLGYARNAIDVAIEEKKEELQEARAKRALLPKQTRFRFGAAA